MTIGHRSRLVSKEFMDILRRYGQILQQKLNGRNAWKRQKCLSIDATYFFRCICTKKNPFTEKQVFEESLRLGKVVKNLEISWINDETTIELFCLQMMCGVM